MGWQDDLKSLLEEAGGAALDLGLRATEPPWWVALPARQTERVIQSGRPPQDVLTPDPDLATRAMSPLGSTPWRQRHNVAANPQVDWVAEARQTDGIDPNEAGIDTNLAAKKGSVILRPGTRRSIQAGVPVEAKQALEMLETNRRYRGRHPEDFPTTLDFKKDRKKRIPLKGLFGGGE